MLDAKVNMIKQQIRSWNVTDEKVLNLFERIDRIHFVTKEQQDLAYADISLPLLHGEEMLSPVVQAKILAALNLQPHEIVLEIGTGNGFLTALLAALAKQVISIEFHKDMSVIAARNLKNQGVLNAELMIGNGLKGQALDQSVDVVLITGALPYLPDIFKTYIKPGGRILAILGDFPAMHVSLITVENSRYVEATLFETVTRTLLRAPDIERFKF